MQHLGNIDAAPDCEMAFVGGTFVCLGVGNVVGVMVVAMMFVGGFVGLLVTRRFKSAQYGAWGCPFGPVQVQIDSSPLYRLSYS